MIANNNRIVLQMCSHQSGRSGRLPAGVGRGEGSGQPRARALLRASATGENLRPVERHKCIAYVKTQPNRCPVQIVPREQVEKFKAKYVSLINLAGELGIHFRRLAVELRAAGIEPALDHKRHGASFCRSRAFLIRRKMRRPFEQRHMIASTRKCKVGGRLTPGLPRVRQGFTRAIDPFCWKRRDRG